MPRDFRRPPASAPDLPTPSPVARPDARVALALAEIVAETDTGSRRMTPAILRDELAARLGDHVATRDAHSAQAAALASRDLAADLYDVTFYTAYGNQDGRCRVRLIPTDPTA